VLLAHAAAIVAMTAVFMAELLESCVRATVRTYVQRTL
jgi:hypothetical protein